MSWTLGTIAVGLLVYAAVSGRLAGTPVTSAMVFVAFGLVVGPETLGLVQLSAGSEPVRVLAEATLALVLFGDAARMELRELRHELAIPARLLAIGLPLTLVAGLATATVVLTDLAWPEALLVAVILAPTDAALGQAVVTLPGLPSRIRHGLNVESGLNDGICVPIFLVVLAVAKADAGAIGHGAAATLLFEQIGYGILAGVAAGCTTAGVVHLASSRRDVHAPWFEIAPVAGAGLAYGIAAPAGGSGFIAAFVGGLVFGAFRRTVDGELTRLLEGGGAILGGITFVVFGAVLLGPALDLVTPSTVLYALSSLTVVRMLPVAIALLGTGARAPTIGFLGWFGPRGLASIVLAVLLEHSSDLPHQEEILTTTFLTIALSVLAHGLTAAPLAARYASWSRSRQVRGVPSIERG